jgi:hypothetical protein
MEFLSNVLYVVNQLDIILKLLVPTLKHLIVLYVDNIKITQIIINVGHATVFFVKNVRNLFVHILLNVLYALNQLEIILKLLVPTLIHLIVLNVENIKVTKIIINV